LQQLNKPLQQTSQTPPVQQMAQMPQMPQAPNSAAPANSLQLNDIHLPEQISDFPIAYGWWLLAVLVIVLSILTLLKIRKNAKRNKVKKQALMQLKNNAEMSNTEIIALLKWAAMHYFSRAELAKLYGNSLQQFLLKQLPEKHQENFIKLSELAFKNQYCANATNTANTSNDKNNNFQQAAILWLTHALPPKQLSNKLSNKKQTIKAPEKTPSEVSNQRSSEASNQVSNKGVKA